MKPYGIHADAVLAYLYRQLGAANSRQKAAAEAMEVASEHDFDWRDDAAEEHDRSSDEIAYLEREIEEIEAGDRDAPTGFSAIYHNIKL